MGTFTRLAYERAEAEEGGAPPARAAAPPPSGFARLVLLLGRLARPAA